jgi:hypothetical protein
VNFSESVFPATAQNYFKYEYIPCFNIGGGGGGGVKKIKVFNLLGAIKISARKINF